MHDDLGRLRGCVLPFTAVGHWSVLSSEAKAHSEVDTALKVYARMTSIFTFGWKSPLCGSSSLGPTLGHAHFHEQELSHFVHKVSHQLQKPPGLYKGSRGYWSL